MVINDKGTNAIKDLVERIIDDYGEDNDMGAAYGYALAIVLKYIIESEKTEE